MIIPCPELPRKWSHYPVTLSLVATNIFVYVLFFSGPVEKSAVMKLTDRDLRTAGRLFMLDSQKDHRPPWAEDKKVLTSARLETYGEFALKDRRFLEALDSGVFTEAAADPIALRTLMSAAKEFHDNLRDRNLHRFGLSSERTSGLAWLTYQFSHAGWIHLISNLVFMILLGFPLETMLGSGLLAVLYLVGGIAGGLAYLHFDPNGVVSVVGASGSVSAFIAAYPLLERRRRIRYFYLILPFRDLFGFVHLPTILIFPLYLITDFAVVLSSPTGGSGGVANSAHIGGAVVGVLIACICIILRWRHVRSNEPDEIEGQQVSK